jgi:hypothetical protein
MRFQPFSLFVRTLFIVWIGFVSSSQVSGQVQSQNTVQLIQDYAVKNIQEKIYVHVDRPDHITGEILWFKIYCTDALMHRPLDLSKIAYVEIIDHNNRPLLQTKVTLENGMGEGSIFVPSTLESGNYLLRAYTRWMMNSSPEFFFKKTITIVNTLKAGQKSSGSKKNTMLDAQFFPEGGYLVDQVSSKVGFKVVDSTGVGVDCSGAIVTHNNDTIVRFKTFKFGIGNFEFLPQLDKTYRALIFGGNNQVLSFNLPKIKRTGYTLRLQDEGNDQVKIIVTNPEGIISAHLIIHTRQSIKASYVISTTKDVYEYVLNKNTLGDGISHITLFNRYGEPVCERLYFKKPTRDLTLNARVDQKEYSIRRKVQLTIPNEQQLRGSLSVSIFRGDSLTRKESIISHFLLTSDLTGYIEFPDYYFSQDPGAHQAGDNLMLTQGWRRFNWDLVLGKTKRLATYLPEINGHIVQGKIVDRNNKPDPGKIAYLSTPGMPIRLYVSQGDSMGRVQFQLHDFEGPRKIITQSNYKIDSLSQVTLESPFSAESTFWSFSTLHLNPATRDELMNRSLAMQIQDAYYESETYFQYRNQKIDSLPFYGQADEVYLLDQYTRFPSMEEIMREYIKGVLLRKKNNEFQFWVIDKVRDNVFRENPLSLLDGVPVFDTQKIMDINPLTVKKIEVLTRKYFLGPLEFPGIISMSTYTGDLGGFTPDLRSISLDYEGLQYQREFFSPQYANPALRASKMPDERYQLHWDPRIKLIPGDLTLVDFYTSDVEGNFYVIIEGISEAGPVFGTTSFQVSR